MSIRLRILLAFSVVVLLAAGVAGYGYQLIAKTSEQVVKLYDGPMMAANYARSAQLIFSKIRRSVERSIVLSEPAKPEELAALNEAMKNLSTDVSVVRERLAGAREFSDGVERIEPLVDHWHKAAISYLKPAGSGVRELIMPREIIAVGDKLSDALDLVAENASAYGFNFRTAAESVSSDSKRNLVVLGVAAVAAGLMMAFVMSKSFSRPIQYATSISEKIASGDFSTQVTTDRKDELGRLLRSLDTTRLALEHTVSGIRAAASDVTVAAAEISSSTTDLSQRTEEQAASLEETSASMEEMSATVRKNAENAHLAEQSAAATREVADRGGEIVGKAVQAMARIEESSNKIADIIGVIDEIARQTNLLALNAAVEAARAGEAGRGFAVVATEVRSLAQRSSQATKDITQLINNSTGEVKEGVELVNRAGGALDEIVSSIRTVTEIVSGIATASAEQASGVDEINRALAQMDELTQRNSALVEENAATAKTLEQQAKAMDQQVAAFRTNAGSADAVDADGHLAAADAPALDAEEAHRTGRAVQPPRKIRAAA